KSVPVWFSIRTWPTAPEQHECDNPEVNNDTVHYGECMKAFAWAAGSCQAGKMSRGGSMPGQCLVYEIVIQETYDEFSPPWDPLPRRRRVECEDGGRPDKGNTPITDSHWTPGDDSIGIKTDFWRGMWTKFCEDHFNGSEHGIPGGWAYEHEDLHGCLTYTISGFYLPRRAL
ncbi:hypothetical protein QBC35DRAFT_368446, partial [Podospora australis]